MAEIPDVMEVTVKDDDEEEEEDSPDEKEDWMDSLQHWRLLLAQRIRFTRIAPSLLCNDIIDQEDKEELESPFINPTETQRINRLVDILLRKGQDNYKKFLEVVGVYYSDIYKEITDEVPNINKFTINISVGDFGSSDGDLVHYLMQALESIKGENQMLKKDNSKHKKQLEYEKEEQERNVKRIQRYETIEVELRSARHEVDRLQHENYTICMRVLETKDENAKLRDLNIKLLYDSDQAKAELQKMENCFEMERTQSVRLRNRLQQGPSEREFMELRKQVDILTLRLTQAGPVKSYCDFDRDKQILDMQKEKEETVELYAKALEDLNKRREECSALNQKCSEYLEEKEQLNLTCAALRSDCTMFKMRRDSVWQQLQEVEKEREMIMGERNEAQTLAKTCMQEKANYRSQLRELETKYDDLKEILLRTEKKLAHEMKTCAREQMTSASSKPLEEAAIPAVVEPFRKRAYNKKHNEEDVITGRQKSDSINELTIKFDEKTNVNKREVKPTTTTTTSDVEETSGNEWKYKATDTKLQRRDPIKEKERKRRMNKKNVKDDEKNEVKDEPATTE